MSYLDNIIRDDVDENLLILLEVDWFFSDREWDNVGGGTNPILRKVLPGPYRPIAFGYAPFDADGTEITDTFDRIEPFTPSLPTSPVRNWSYDRANNEIYARINVISPVAVPETDLSGDGVLGVRNTLIVKFLIPIAQQPLSWYVDPQDDATDIVRYLPLLDSSFEVKNSLRNSPYGVLPTYSSTMRVKNDSGYLTPLLRSGKFAGSRAVIYRMSGPPATANVGKLFVAELGDARITDDAISLTIKEQPQGIGKLFSVGGTTMSSVGSFVPAPERENANIKAIFGMARDMRLECRNYSATITTANNRIWLVCPKMGETDVSTSVTGNATVSSRIDLGSSAAYFGVGGNERLRFRLGDRVRVTDGTNTEYRVLVRCEMNGTPIPPSITIPGFRYTFDTALSSVSSSTATMSKFQAARVFMHQQGNKYEMMPTRDYTMSVSGDYIILTLTTNCEVNIGASTINPATDFIAGTFYGPRLEHATINMGSTAIRSSATMPAVSHPAFVMYLILTQSGALTTSEFSVADLEAIYAEDLAQFSTYVLPNIGRNSVLTMVEPATSSANRRRVVDVLRDIATTYNILIFTDINGVLRFKIRSDPTALNHVVGEDDIIGNIDYEHDYSSAYRAVEASYEISEVSNFDNHPIGARRFRYNSITGKPFYDNDTTLAYNCTSSPSWVYHLPNLANSIFTITTPLHEVNAVTAKGPWSSAQLVAANAGLQRNIYKFRLKKKFSQVDFGQTITLRRERLPGFAYEKGVVREVIGDIISITRSIDSVEVEIEDRRVRQVFGRAVKKFI
jgi:hypothetical protein